MAKSKIEWTELSWNPTTGCTKISEGCRYCYAEIMSRRLQAMGVKKYRDNFKIKIHENELLTPYTWKTPRIVFVNSMSDLFHKEIPIEFVIKVFEVMRDNPQHVFQILTKRADILRYYDSESLIKWTHNIWMGVSVENNIVTERIDLLRKTGAIVKFLSCEPLIGPLSNLNLQGIDWVIVGGESGKKSRPMKKEWVTDIKDQCLKANIAFFFKQWGGINKMKNGRLLEGKTWDEMPIGVETIH